MTTAVIATGAVREKKEKQDPEECVWTVTGLMVICLLAFPSAGLKQRGNQI